MIKSMTGYGSASGTFGQIEISIELKSVNSRYLDCNIKMPKVYIAVEEQLKAAIQQYISRGKVDVFITIDTSSATDVAIKLNRPLAEAYMTALRTLSDEFNIPCNVSAVDLTRFSDVLQAEKSEVDTDALYSALTGVLLEALENFNDMRSREGEKLASDIYARLSTIERLTDLIERISPRSVLEYRKKLESRMKEVLDNTDIDESRLLLETALFADKVAVSEETVRLKSHIDQMNDILKSEEPSGRKLDFLVQELNREANTIGSKGNDAEMSRIVIDLKAEIEKIREQAQNIE